MQFDIEICKYKLNKKNIENTLYVNLRELYRLLLIQIKYTDMLLDNPQKVVAENVYSASVPAMNNFVNIIKLLQYEPFVKNSFAHTFYDFKQYEMSLLEKYMSACMIFLQLSILKTTIEKSEHGVIKYSPVSSDEKVWETLKTMKIEAEKRCKAVDELIRAEGLIPRPSGAKQGVLNPTAIPYENTIPRCSAVGLVIFSLDNNCKHRFSWKKDKAIVDAFNFNSDNGDIRSFFEDK